MYSPLAHQTEAVKLLWRVGEKRLQHIKNSLFRWIHEEVPERQLSLVTARIKELIIEIIEKWMVNW